MSGPLDEPEGNWWDTPVNRRESIWLGIAGVWSLAIFGWMSGFTRFGDQNPVGETFRVTPQEFRQTVQEYKEESEENDDGAIIPAGDSVYIAGQRFDWDGLPVVLETDREYEIHLGAYDVQHGFSIRPEETLSKQINLQIFPDMEWIIPMTFDEPGTYHVICNEFCGRGHNGMHNVLYVEDP